MASTIACGHVIVGTCPAPGMTTSSVSGIEAATACPTGCGHRSPVTPGLAELTALHPARPAR